MTYNSIKKILKNGNPRGFITIEKLDVFLMGNRITTDEYNELVEMLNALSEEE